MLAASFWIDLTNSAMRWAIGSVDATVRADDRDYPVHELGRRGDERR